jgi:toxin-antitoxin system PIN domain toxin
MMLVDANVLIYAVDADAPNHDVARRWLETALSGDASVGLAWVVLLAFVRITTRRGVLRNPMAADRALAYVGEWLARPNVTTVVPGEHHWPIFRRMLAITGAAGNLVSDAHLAALALEHGATIWSTDHDFARFPGVEHRNPLH